MEKTTRTSTHAARISFAAVVGAIALSVFPLESDARSKKAAVAQRKKVNDDEASGIAQLEKEGMTVVSKVDGQGFRDALKPAYASYAKEFGADNIRKIQEVK